MMMAFYERMKELGVFCGGLDSGFSFQCQGRKGIIGMMILDLRMMEGCVVFSEFGDILCKLKGDNKERIHRQCHW